MSQKHEKSDRDIETAHQWLQTAATELGVDPGLLRPVIKDLLDLTRDVAHGPSRPAAPLTAFLVGLAAGGALPEGVGQEEAVAAIRERIGRISGLIRENYGTQAAAEK